MAPKRVANRLMALDVGRLPAGLYRDGAGLLLQVTPRKDGEGLSRSWILRFKSPATGKRRDMGLGSVLSLSLSEARTAAKNARTSVAMGTDPLEPVTPNARQRGLNPPAQSHSARPPTAILRRTDTHGATIDRRRNGRAVWRLTPIP